MPSSEESADQVGQGLLCRSRLYQELMSSTICAAVMMSHQQTLLLEDPVLRWGLA